MDFNIKKPAHILSLLLILITCIIFIFSPILSFFGALSTNTIDTIGNFPTEFKIIFEIILLTIQLVLVLILFILFPILWYYLVNGKDFKNILIQIKLKKENINNSILWSIITVIIIFIIIAIIGISLQFFGFDLTDSSNIPQLELYFSIPTILILIVIQPIGEEIFFRGFLLDKFNNLFGKTLAIILTSLLFGIAHLSYGNVYPAVLTSIIGIILAILVIKTNNLYSAIFAHVIFNVMSYSFFILSKSVQILPVIL